ncbi:MAG: DUF5615 family PIN-like protein [Armatimonadia bacterium]
MRLLADENVPAAIVHILRTTGHDVEWVREMAPGIKDKEVLARANASERFLLTFDKDFGELVFRERLSGSPGVILLRIPQPSPAEVALFVSNVLSSREDWSGHFAVVMSDRIRMIPLRQ